MDYLRSLGSAAASSILQKSGLNLPFSLGERVGELGIWSLHDATKRDDGSNVSVFVFEAGQRKDALPLAKNAVRKLRTIRHPDVLKFLDAVESDTVIYIMTERVKPLAKALGQDRKAKERMEWLVWGLHRVSVALAFINDSAGSTHGAIRVDSVLITPSGEWKLGGFDLLSSPKDDAAVLYSMGSLLPDANTYCSPEVRKGGYTALKENDVAAADAYALGILIHSVFNPSAPVPPTTLPPHPPIAGTSRGAIPASIFAHYKRLLNPNPRARLSAKGFLELGMDAATGFFATNALVKVCAGLDNFALASEGDKVELIRTLRDSATSFPAEFNAHRVLPSLVSALEYGGANAAAMVPVVVSIGKDLPTTDNSKKEKEQDQAWLGPLVKLYGSGDRATRMALLDHLPEYAERLDARTVTDRVWPALQTGFADTVPLIREATVRAISLLSPKLGDRILNNDLLRHLAKMQLDPEPSIRTNTCILLGRLAPKLGANTKKKVLVPAFARATKDAFVHARVAGVMAFGASVDAGCFESEAIAERVLPCVAACLVDREKIVRDAAFKAVDGFIKGLKAHAETLPETVAVPQVDSVTATGGEGTAPPVGYGSNATGFGSTSAAGFGTAAGLAGTTAAGGAALAGWAISSLSKQLGAGDVISQMTLQTASALMTQGQGAASVVDRPMSAPPPPASGLSGAVTPKQIQPKPPMASPTPSFASASGTTSAPKLGAAGSKAKGMQLGANKVPRSALASQIARAEEEEKYDGWADDADADAGHDGDGADAWDGDLMDVTADQGDWSAFESAPVARVPGGFGDENDDEDDNPWADSSTAAAAAPPSLSYTSSARAAPKPKPKPAPISSLVGTPVAPASKPVEKEKPPPIKASALARVARPAATFHTVVPPPLPKPKLQSKSNGAGDGWGDSWDDGEQAEQTEEQEHEEEKEKVLTKDEKAAEMARRREERKQRIAAAKEKRAMG